MQTGWVRLLGFVPSTPAFYTSSDWFYLAADFEVLFEHSVKRSFFILFFLSLVGLLLEK